MMLSAFDEMATVFAFISLTSRSGPAAPTMAPVRQALTATLSAALAILLLASAFVMLGFAAAAEAVRWVLSPILSAALAPQPSSNRYANLVQRGPHSPPPYMREAPFG